MELNTGHLIINILVLLAYKFYNIYTHVLPLIEIYEKIYMVYARKIIICPPVLSLNLRNQLDPPIKLLIILLRNGTLS
jgi:hypothetical protein